MKRTILCFLSLCLMLFASAQNTKKQMVKIQVGNKIYNVANHKDVAKIYKEKVNKDKCFFIISKKEFRLYVYEVAGIDTSLVAHFPVCYAKYPEGKTKEGDMRTPDCDIRAPFTISEIKDASTWSHDFKDGRGSILSYGKWFMRLNLKGATNCTPAVRANRSIGIHGSTNNATSVPGRDSEGCIRLRDADLITLHDLYAKVGTPVVVLPFTKDKYPFEKKAQQKLGELYEAPVFPLIN